MCLVSPLVRWSVRFSFKDQRRFDPRPSDLIKIRLDPIASGADESPLVVRSSVSPCFLRNGVTGRVLVHGDS
jgi:hypothetical protein